jgi:hypothetical protein
MLVRNPFKVVGLISSCIAAASCVSSTPSPPPKHIALNYEAESGSLGYVVSLGYFTPAEMRDPVWEFARVQNAGMNWCRSESRFRRRDVRWVSVGRRDGKKCALAIYTVECLEPRNVTDHVDPKFSDHLDQTRSRMLTSPLTNLPGEDCGRKDIWEKEYETRGSRPAREPSTPVGARAR